MKKLVLVFIIAVFIISAYTLNVYPQKTMERAPAPEFLDAAEESLRTGGEMPGGAAGSPLFITFSKPPGFYDEEIEIEILSSVDDAVIYYTTDGSEPTSENGVVYTEPLRFSVLLNARAVVLKAIARHEAFETRPLVHTYFLGNNINERFTTLVFSLSTNEEYLFDYDTGIFVAGRLRDEYVAANPRVNIDPPAPANFNLRGRESERPMYVEVFTKDGRRVIAQLAGARVQGGWSRANSQKSIRLIARQSYETNAGKFRYDFFPGETIPDAFGTPLTEFDQLVLRNGANDRDFGMLRNEVASKLARDMGFREVSPWAPAAVFLNGEYYGFAWIQVSINEQYLQDLYGAPTKDFEIIGDGDHWFKTDNREAKNDLDKMNSYADKDLTDDAVFSELNEMLDVNNFLLYYAFETYMDNNDWPHNNMKRWRYTGPLPEGPEYPEELDGRWRYIMYDLDWTLGLYEYSYTVDSIRRVTGGSPLLTALLKRDETRDLFVQYIMAISSNIVTEQTVTAAVDELYGMASAEISRALGSGKYSRWVSKDTIANNHKFMINYALHRPESMIGHLNKRLYYGDPYTVIVTGGLADFGAGKGTEAAFLNGGEVIIRPVLPPHHTFEKWMLNGTKSLYEEEIIISSFMAIDNTVSLQLVTSEQLPALVFLEAYSEANRSGCALSNPNGFTVSTEGLFISDDPDRPWMWELPEASIEPGGTLAFVGRGGADISDIHKVQLPFRIAPNEVLILSDADGNVIDSIVVR